MRGVAGFLLVLGAILAFALDEDDPAWLGVRLEPLGVIILALGILLIVGPTVRGALRALQGASLPTFEGLQPIAGLLAVLIGVVAVCVLAVVALARLTGDAASTVAMGSAALGVISAVVGAYLGIKTSAEQGSEARRDAQEAQAQLGAAKAAVQRLPDQERERAERAMAGASEGARRTVNRTGA
jgi:hypothetical protein